MVRISIINCFILLTIILFYVTEIQSFEPPNDHNHRESSPMWFGPRIGRKKRFPEDENKIYRNDKDLIDVLKESPLVVVAVRDANKQHNFIPRLGRESGENQNNWDGDVEVMMIDDTPSKPINPFSPRLGRNTFNPFSPRLGRESNVQPLN